MGGLTAVFFQFLFGWQALPAFLVAVIVSPSLIAADLSNNALSLYLSRPITRRDYVLGKMAVLAILLSPITWMGGLLIFVLQAYLEGNNWGVENWRIGMAYLVGHITWIVVISLLTLAISAWVRFKPAARGALFGIIFILAGFAQAINAVTGTSVGDLIHLTRAIANVVMSIFGGPTQGDLPIALNWFTLIATCAAEHLDAPPQAARPRGGRMSAGTITVSNVSKFYGEVLGVNRVTRRDPAGSHRSRRTQRIGQEHADAPAVRSAQTDPRRHQRSRHPPGSTRRALPRRRLLHPVRQLPQRFDRLQLPQPHPGAARSRPRRGRPPATWEILERVGLTEAGKRRIAGYSKGMRQRIKLAQAICHDPRVLILDEPLNGLDPMGRAEMIDLFKEFARDGRHVIVSSHILHEVDLISDGVIMIHGGSVVAEGSIREVRGEITTQPLQILVRCDRPQAVAARAFELPHVVEARIVDDATGVLLRTTNAAAFFPELGRHHPRHRGRGRDRRPRPTRTSTRSTTI